MTLAIDNEVLQVYNIVWLLLLTWYVFVGYGLLLLLLVLTWYMFVGYGLLLRLLLLVLTWYVFVGYGLLLRLLRLLLIYMEGLVQDTMRPGLVALYIQGYQLDLRF